MSKLYKFVWLIRALVYKLFLGRIGSWSYLGRPIFIANPKKIFIGSKVRIFPLSRIEVIGHDAEIIIENNVSIGDGFHIVSADKMLIKSNVTISANVMITNLDHEYEVYGKHIMEQGIKVKKTVIGENCFIGYGAFIQAGTVLGDNCIVGANSVVRGSYPAGSVLVGAPAKIVKKYNITEKKWINQSHS